MQSNTRDQVVSNLNTIRDASLDLMMIARECILDTIEYAKDIAWSCIMWPAENTITTAVFVIMLLTFLGIACHQRRRIWIQGENLRVIMETQYHDVQMTMYRQHNPKDAVEAINNEVELAWHSRPKPLRRFVLALLDAVRANKSLLLVVVVTVLGMLAYGKWVLPSPQC